MIPITIPYELLIIVILTMMILAAGVEDVAWKAFFFFLFILSFVFLITKISGLNLIIWGAF